MEERKLRNGYTTGTCAAAAARAAAIYQLKGDVVDSVDVILPNGERVKFAVEKANTPISCFRVRKDAGDDPDVTDKAYIYAACKNLTDADLLAIKKDAKNDKGYLMQGRPDIYITGGPGIGIVTRKGLSCPIGHYAINPAPRDEIATAVRRVCEESDHMLPLCITLSVPEGAALARKTFNPRLGIVGGISILGTSGIVRPMSEEAVLDTIRLQIHMRKAAGDTEVIFTPGNYGESFLREKLGIPEGTAVQISNYVKDSLIMARDEGFRKVFFAGHLGKLIKVAAGFPNTHSRYGDKRMETFLLLLKRVMAVNESLCEKIMAANTTDEALLILAKAFPDDAGDYVTALLNETAEAVKMQMEKWVKGELSVEVLVFSRGEDIGMTKDMLKEGYRNT